MGATVCFFSPEMRVTRTFNIAGVTKGNVPAYRSGRVMRYTANNDCPISAVQQGRLTQDMARIHALEAELLQYRRMVEKLVRQRTMQLTRRIAILKSCNARVCDEYNKVREKYQDLLIRTNADEARLSVRPTTELAGHPASDPRVSTYRPRPLVESLTRQLHNQNERRWLASSEAERHEFDIKPVAKWSVIPQAREIVV